jgi:tripartite-type tricarboxylate transporter receptor subunit TctC
MVMGENASWAAYPERAIEIIVPFGVGGGSDTAARAVAEGLKPHIKAPLLITNMPGGGATKGMLHAFLQPADGYTVLAVTTSHLIDAVKPKTRSQLLRTSTRSCGSSGIPPRVFVSGIQIQDLADLVDWGKKNPKQLGSRGPPGGWSEIQTVAFFKKVGVEATFMPFESGAEIKAAILGGHIHGALEELAETLPLAKAGKLKALCVIMEKRHPAIPEVPCSAELGVDYTHGLMRAWGIKKGTPPDRASISTTRSRKPWTRPSIKNSSRTTTSMPVPGTSVPKRTRSSGKIR